MYIIKNTLGFIMKNNAKALLIRINFKLIFILITVLIFLGIFLRVKTVSENVMKSIVLFNKQDIEDRIQFTKEEIEKKIIFLKSHSCKESLIQLRLIDEILDLYSKISNSISFTTYIYTDKMVIDFSNEKIKELSDWWNNLFFMDYEIYNLLKETYKKNRDKIDSVDSIFFNDLFRTFKDNGSDLSEENRKKLMEYKKVLLDLSITFQQNIILLHEKIYVTRKDLDGVPDDFIKELEYNLDNNVYSLLLNYPTYDKIMKLCKNKITRKKYFIAFNKRGYPDNLKLLKEIQEIRNNIAILLGYKNYSEYDISNSMAKTVETVENFCKNILLISKEEAKKEKLDIISKKPEYITYNQKTELFDPEDILFLFDYIQKTYYNVDNELIAEYFEAENTIKKIIELYSDFFNISFKKQSKSSWWYSDDLYVFEVYSKDNLYIGTLLLDLYPRENKYSHACFCPLLNGFFDNEKKYYPAGAVIGNFTKATKDKPSLLKFNEVNTLLHELGHTLHHLFGMTRYSTQSGTNVKSDFVEVPSQLFEQLLKNKKIVSSISSHYKTKEKIPLALIEKINELDSLGRNIGIQRQLKMSLLSLNLFRDKNVDGINLNKALEKEVISLGSLYEDNYFLCSFSHLVSDLYGSKYYSYLWSLVYALDLFEEMKMYNLENKIGEKFKNIVLSNGNQRESMDLIEDFLNRKTSFNAFEKYLKKEI